MAWYDKTPKGIDVEELVKRLIIEYAERNKHSIRDENNNKYNILIYNQDFVKDVSKALVSNVFGVLFNQSSTTQGSKNSQNADLLSIIERIDRTTFTGLTYEDKSKGKHYYGLPSIMEKQSTMNETLTAILSELSRLTQVQETEIKEKNIIIQKQHDSLLRYDNDLLHKTKCPLLNELIGIADQIKQIADDQSVKEDYTKLLEDVHALGDWVDAALQTESVRKFEYAKQDKSKLDSKCQEVVETQYTSNIEEDGIYKTMLPGYFWTIPMVGASAMQNIQTGPCSFEFILRPEQVVRLIYKPEHVEKKLTKAEIALVIKEDPLGKEINMEDSKKKPNVDDLLTRQNDYGNERVDQVPIREDKCDSLKDTLKDQISNGQALLLDYSSDLHFDNRGSSLKGNRISKGKYSKK